MVIKTVRNQVHMMNMRFPDTVLMIIKITNAYSNVLGPHISDLI